MPQEETLFLNNVIIARGKNMDGTLPHVYVPFLVTGLLLCVAFCRRAVYQDDDADVPPRRRLKTHGSRVNTQNNNNNYYITFF